MSNLLALSVHDGRGESERERDGREKRERDAVMPNEVVALQPFNQTQFSAVVYVSSCGLYFYRGPKTNSEGA